MQNKNRIRQLLRRYWIGAAHSYFQEDAAAVEEKSDSGGQQLRKKKTDR
jgi:hypothetical protein